jgi:membrane protein
MQKIKEFIIRIYNFIRHDIWRMTGHELSRSRRVSYSIIKTIVLAVRGFTTDRLNEKASALTYSLLLAIVPIIALAISIAKGFGLELAIEDSLQGTYIDKMNLTPMVMSFVESYLETAKGGFFIGIGIVILLVSVTSFFMQVETSFNDIWQVKKSRSIIRQFTTYFSIILLVPVLLIVSSGLSIYISSAFSSSFLYEFLNPFVRVLVNFLPFVIVWIGFTVSYMAIPNTQVKFVNALVAGVIAGTAFQVFQMLYVSGQVNLSRYNAIYGGFAAIPLLLIWLRISCLIVLFGAELSYASQNIHNFDYETDTKTISVRYRNFLYLYITYLIIHQFETQKPPLTPEEISTKNSLPSRLVNQLLSKLVDANVLIEVYNEMNKTKSYQPAVDINQITAGFLFDKLETQGSELFLPNNNPQMIKFWEQTLYLRQCSKCEGDKVLIKDIY